MLEKQNLDPKVLQWAIGHSYYGASLGLGTSHYDYGHHWNPG